MIILIGEKMVIKRKKNISLQILTIARYKDIVIPGLLCLHGGTQQNLHIGRKSELLSQFCSLTFHCPPAREAQLPYFHLFMNQRIKNSM